MSSIEASKHSIWEARVDVFGENAPERGSSSDWKSVAASFWRVDDGVLQLWLVDGGQAIYAPGYWAFVREIIGGGT